MSNYCIADFAVVNGTGANLLLKCTAEKLGLLHVGPGAVYLIDNDIVARHKPLFTGVEKLKNYQLKLLIDELIKQVAESLRHASFQLLDEVNFKLNESLECDIIEEVPDSPTKWVSPL